MHITCTVKLFAYLSLRQKPVAVVCVRTSLLRDGLWVLHFHFVTGRKSNMYLSLFNILFDVVCVWWLNLKDIFGGRRNWSREHPKNTKKIKISPYIFDCMCVRVSVCVYVQWPKTKTLKIVNPFGGGRYWSREYQKNTRKFNLCIII